MVELQYHTTRVQQENNRLRTRLEADYVENIWGCTHPTPPVQPSKGKEPILPDNSDLSTNDELSFSSSPLPDLPPPLNYAEAKSRKRPPCRSSRSISGMPCRVHREVSKEKRYSKLALKNMPTWHGVWLHRFHS